MWEENPCTMLIRRLYLSLARLSNRILHQHDLTMSQLMTLLLLSGSSEKELSLKELERLLQTSQPDVAGIASRLEKKGLVTRFPDAADRRVKRLSITTQGEQSCCAARGEIRRGEDTLLAGMTPEEQNAFRRLLEKAAQNLTRSPASTNFQKKTAYPVAQPAMPSFFHPIWLLISPVSSRKVICTGLWSELSKPVSMTFDCSTVTLAETRKPSTVRTYCPS